MKAKALHQLRTGESLTGKAFAPLLKNTPFMMISGILFSEYTNPMPERLQINRESPKIDDVLKRIPKSQKSKLKELLPDKWKRIIEERKLWV